MVTLFALALLLTIAIEVPVVSLIAAWRVGRGAVPRAAVVSALASGITLPVLWWLQLSLGSALWPTTAALETGVAVAESGALLLAGRLRPGVAFAAGVSSNALSWASGAALFAWLGA